jgi:hypothetical protein
VIWTDPLRFSTLGRAVLEIGLCMNIQSFVERRRGHVLLGEIQ